MNYNSERFYSNLKTFKRCSDSCVKIDDRTYYVCFFSEKEGKVKCCDLCLQRNLRKKQTHFCKTKSEVPKALCKDCAHQHTRKKASRYHEVCKSPGGFPSFQR